MLRLSLLVAGCYLLLSLTPPPPPVRSSPIAASAVHVVSVNPDSGSVTILDARTNAVLGEVAVGGTPETVAISTSGGRAYVASREGVLTAIDLGKRAVAAAVKVDAQLFGVAATSSLVYVTAPATGRLHVVNPSTLATIATVDTEPYPRGVAVAGWKIYVTHFRSGRLTILDESTRALDRVVATTDDANLSQGIFASQTHVYLPQTRSNSTNEMLLFDTTVFPVVEVIDTVRGEHLPRDRFALDIIDRPVNMPLDAIVTGDKLYAVNAGSDDVSVIDIARRVAAARLNVGSNPRGMTLSADGRTIWVNNTLSGTISVIDVASDRVTATVNATRIPLPAHILNGKILFNSSNSTTLTKDRWISCASCHFDGATDGRTWFFSDGPRNTPSLFGVHETLPMHWSGDLAALHDVGDTIRTIQSGSGLGSADLDDLVAFMRSLRAPPHPPARDNNAVLRGRALFLDPRTGCASCHATTLYTDRHPHDVGTGAGPLERKGARFDTPSLRGVADTAPYLHDGSAATLHDVLRNATGQHGNTTGLSATEIDDLVAFLESLPFPQPRRRAL